MTAGDIVDLLRIAVRSVRPPQRPGHPAARRAPGGHRRRLAHAAGGERRPTPRRSGFYVARQFSVIDVRPHYYRDGSEALVMCRWLPGAARTGTRRPPMTDEPLVLGIETSCDETGVGIVRGHTLLADAVASSVEEHARFGGVVPEVASRAHLEAMVPTIERAVRDRRHRADRHRRGRGHQRTRPRRRAARRVSRAPRRWRWGWASRSTASTTSPRTWRSTSSSTDRCPSRAWRCSSRAATPACSRSPT